NGDGTFWVRGEHSYSSGGRYSVVLSISDHGGAATWAALEVDVAADVAAAAVPVGAVSGVPSGAVTLLTLQTSAADAAGLAASVDWGDGQQSTGSIVAADAG